MGLDIGIPQVRGLLEDEKFIKRVVKKMLRNEDTKEELVEQIAESLGQAIESDSALRSTILLRALDDNSFRGKVAGALMEELIDG